MTPGTIGWPWFLSPKTDITVLGSNHTSTPVSKVFMNWNDLVLNSRISVLLVTMFISRLTCQKNILSRTLKLCWNLGVQNECLKTIRVSVKRYPRGSFWSGYEHHESTGRKNLEESSQYIRDQQRHHDIMVIDDAQLKLDLFFPPTGDAAWPNEVRACRGKEGGKDHKDGVLISQSVIVFTLWVYSRNIFLRLSMILARYKHLIFIRLLLLINCHKTRFFNSNN